VLPIFYNFSPTLLNWILFTILQYFQCLVWQHFQSCWYNWLVFTLQVYMLVSNFAKFTFLVPCFVNNISLHAFSFPSFHYLSLLNILLSFHIASLTILCYMHIESSISPPFLKFRLHSIFRFLGSDSFISISCKTIECKLGPT